MKSFIAENSWFIALYGIFGFITAIFVITYINDPSALYNDRKPEKYRESALAHQTPEQIENYISRIENIVTQLDSRQNDEDAEEAKGGINMFWSGFAMCIAAIAFLSGKFYSKTRIVPRKGGGYIAEKIPAFKIKIERAKDELDIALTREERKNGYSRHE